MLDVKNFLPEQYLQTGKLAINHNYLSEQFSDYEVIFEKIKTVVHNGDYTLGDAVDHLEGEFKKIVGTKHAIGVGSGTDALLLSLKALGIGVGDEVITTPFTFYATIGAIVTAGATPVFADIQDDYNIDPQQIENKITDKTKAILPVHWAGKPCEMDRICEIAQQYGLHIIEDACHAIKATYREQYAGSFGELGCFSFHPLKNLNVWGDGGMIVTDSDELANRLRLLRNHGLKGRDECVLFAYNSRLDTIQAVVASHLLQKLEKITSSRINNASYFDRHLSHIKQLVIPKRESYIKQVYHLYSICAEQRDQLLTHLIKQGVDAKIHYPIPMHLQSAAQFLGHKRSDFPKSEQIAASTISLPVHEFLTQESLDIVIKNIEDFYS